MIPSVDESARRAAPLFTWRGQLRAHGRVVELGDMLAPTWEAARLAFGPPAAAAILELSFPELAPDDRPALDVPPEWPIADPRVWVWRPEEEETCERCGGTGTAYPDGLALEGRNESAECPACHPNGSPAPAVEALANGVAKVNGAFTHFDREMRRLVELYERSAKPLVELLQSLSHVFKYPVARLPWPHGFIASMWRDAANQRTRVFEVRRYRRVRGEPPPILEYRAARGWTADGKHAAEFPWGVARQIAAGTRNAWLEEAIPF